MKRIKNSQLILFGIIIIIIAVFLIMYNYFMQKKDTVYSKMNIRLFESEQAENIIVDKEEKIENNTIEEIETPNDTNTEQKKPEKKPGITYEYIGMIEIPKINLKRGFVDLNSEYNSIKYNVTVVNTSNYPDVEYGNLILSAHAGNAYNSFFGKLHKLVNGDKVYIYYNNVKYEYKVVNMYEIQKTGYANIYRDFNKTTLTLITCKDNSDTLQIVYIAELVNKKSY